MTLPIVALVAWQMTHHNELRLELDDVGINNQETALLLPFFAVN